MKNHPLTHHPVHLIYRLHGSLPKALLTELKQEYREKLEEIKGSYTQAELRDERIYQRFLREKEALEAQFEQQYDYLLDRTVEGPDFLKHAAVQKLVVDSWRSMQEMQWVEVYAVSVMPNHVHVLACHPEVKGSTPLEPLMRKHKRFTGRQINDYLGRKGEAVWEVQVFDRDVRPGKLGMVFWYVLNNPVKAGLCKSYEEWPGNYWHPDWV